MLSPRVVVVFEGGREVTLTEVLVYVQYGLLVPLLLSGVLATWRAFKEARA